MGPVWATDSWSCTSSGDFMVYGALRALSDAQLAISITGVGTQSLYTFDTSNMQSFSVGAPADQTMILTRTGTVTGFITLQTTAGSTASCTSG